MPRLTMLQPTVQPIAERLRAAQPTESFRLTGRRAVARRQRWLREHPLCAAHAREGLICQAVEVDHIVPLWAGGADDESNFQGLCVEAHKVKTEREATLRARGELPSQHPEQAKRHSSNNPMPPNDFEPKYVIA